MRSKPLASFFKRVSLVLILFTATFPAMLQAQSAQSRWVYPEPDGRLSYLTTPKGDRIMDFSFAGYRSGGVALPDVPVKITVFPPADPAEDCTARIQSAIDEVSALAPDENGFRGTVLLAPGEFRCSGELIISTDGVVLRGSGSSRDGRGTAILMTGEKHAAIRASLPTNTAPRNSEELFFSKITDLYVPAASREFTVADGSGFKAGDEIELRRPVTESWIEFMQMHDLVRDEKPQTWIRPGTVITMRRRIAAVDGNRITVEVPLSDSFDATYLNPPGTRVVKVLPPQLLTEVGIEHFSIVSPAQAVNHSQELYMAIRLTGKDCWIRDIRCEETMNSVSVGGRRITLQQVAVIRKALHSGASKPAEFAPNGTQVLMDRCYVEGDNIWFMALGGQVSGPIVLLNCRFDGNGRAEGHQRWTTGLLMDNCVLPNGGIDFKNRGSMGSGHGWGLGWAVAWNCQAKDIVNQRPPGVLNWSIGSSGERKLIPRPFGSGPLLPEGEVDSPGVRVSPGSLYLAQLRERLGDEALRAIGYSSPDELPDPTPAVY